VTTRLAVTLALPVLGVVALLVVLLPYGGNADRPVVRYGGRGYTGGAVAGPAAGQRLGAVPTGDRVGGLQVWIKRSARAPSGPPSLVLLERPDGSFQIYTPLGEP
jgi:hypothetical protein